MRHQLEEINEKYLQVKKRLEKLQLENVQYIPHDLVKEALEDFKGAGEYPEGINQEYLESTEGLQNLRKEMGEILLPKAVLQTLYVKDEKRVKPLQNKEEWRDFLEHRNKQLNLYEVDTFLTEGGNEIRVYENYEPPYYEYKIESHRSVAMDFMGVRFFLANLIPIHLFVEKDEIDQLTKDNLHPFCVQDFLHLDLLWDLLQTIFSRDEILEANHLYILLEELEELIHHYAVYVYGLDLSNFVIQQVKNRTYR